MKQIAAASLAFAALTAGAQTTNYNQVQHIHTSLNHLTVIELGEPIRTLAVADPDAFSVEQHSDKVFLKPVREKMSTNLFVWTATRQISYELDPPSNTANMDVLIRTLPVVAAIPPEPSTAALVDDDRAVAKVADLVASEILADSRDIQRDFRHTSDGRVGIQLEQVFRSKTTTYIRYTVENKTDHPFRVVSPVLEMMTPTAYPSNLAAHRNHQLNQSTADSYKALTGVPVSLVDSPPAAKDIAPGEKVTEVVGFHAFSGDLPGLIRFELGKDTDRPVTAAMVL